MTKKFIKLKQKSLVKRVKCEHHTHIYIYSFAIGKTGNPKSFFRYPKGSSKTWCHHRRVHRRPRLRQKPKTKNEMWMDVLAGQMMTQEQSYAVPCEPVQDWMPAPPVIVAGEMLSSVLLLRPPSFAFGWQAVVDVVGAALVMVVVASRVMQIVGWQQRRPSRATAATTTDGLGSVAHWW